MKILTENIPNFVNHKFMKKILLLLLVSFLAAGCSYGNLTDLQNQNKDLQTKVDELQKQNQAIQQNNVPYDFTGKISDARQKCLADAENQFNSNIRYQNDFGWHTYPAGTPLWNGANTKLQEDRDFCLKEYPINGQ